jgi:hypothetical protein
VTDNVVSLKGGDVSNERREAFMRAVATSYELYVRDYGCEPDALVYILNGLTKPSLVAWDIQGESMGGATSILSFAAVHLMTEAGASRQGL